MPHMGGATQHTEGRKPVPRTREAGRPVAGSHEAGKPVARAHEVSKPVPRTREAGRPVAGSHEAGKPRNANPRARSAANTNSAANTRARNAANAATAHKKVDPAQAGSTDNAGSTNNADSTNKELRRMSRSELIEVIYALEQDNVSLQKENKKLRAELDDKDIRIATSGSIAEAALSLNHIFEDAQAAANQYLDSIKRKQVFPNNGAAPVPTSVSTPRGRHAL